MKHKTYLHLLYFYDSRENWVRNGITNNTKFFAMNLKYLKAFITEPNCCRLTTSVYNFIDFVKLQVKRFYVFLMTLLIR